MRWPFHFGRSPKSDKAHAAEPAPTRREWASLPPIQRAAGEPELTAPTMEFVESLAGSHGPATSLEALGHQVSMEAPHGLVSGIARTITTYSPSSEMIGRPRRAGQALSAQRAFDDFPSIAEPGEMTEHEEAPEQLAPIRGLRPVEATAASPQPLTRLAEPDRAALLSLASVQRSRVPAAERAPDRTPSLAPTPAVEQPPSAATTETAVPPAEAPPVTQRLTLGQSRRLGLGPPLQVSALPALPTSTSTTPIESSASMPLARLVPAAESEPARIEHLNPSVVLASLDSKAGPAADTTVQAIAEYVAPSPAPPLPVLPVVTHQVRTSPSAPEPRVELVAAGDLRVAQRQQPTPPAAPVATQRSPTAQLVSSRPPLPVATSAARPMDSTQPTLGPETVQLMAGPPIELGSIPRPSDHVQPPLPWTHGPVRPFAASAVPESPQLALRSVQRSAAAPAQTYAAPLAFASPIPAPPAFEPGFFAVSPFAIGMPQIQVQRQAAAGAASPLPPAPAESLSAVAPATAASATSAHDSEKELDELARKLHDRISARLRYDLLLDRERAGMLTDVR